MIDLENKSLFIEINFNENSDENVLICTREENNLKLTRDLEDSSQIPLSLFGVLTDIQYADHETHVSFDNKHRYYRNSLDLVTDAVNNWREYSARCRRKFDFILELGNF